MNEENLNNLPPEDASAKPDEEKINPGHEKTRKKLRIAGISCIVAAIPLMCIPFVGFPLMFAGLVMTIFGFAGKMARYQAAEMAPVQKDTLNYMANGTQEGIKTVGKAVGEGLAAGIGTGRINPSGATAEPGVRCHKCNFIETSNAKFCSKCGEALVKSKPCPTCNELNDPDAKFCDNCGKAL